MGRGVKAPDGLAEQLYELLRSATNPIALKRIQCVYFRVKYGYAPEDIATMVGYHPNYVKQVLAAFWKGGESALQQKPRGGRRRAHLSVEDEQAFVATVWPHGATETPLAVQQVHAAYQQHLGRAVAVSTTYRLLQRHGWRDPAPYAHRRNHARAKGKKRPKPLDQARSSSSS